MFDYKKTDPMLQQYGIVWCFIKCRENIKCIYIFRQNIFWELSLTKYNTFIFIHFL